MELKKEIVDGLCIITIMADSLEAMNSKTFKDQIAPHLAANRNLILNFGPVSFIDSSGCGALLSCLRQLNARDGDLKICNASRPVKTVFELVRLNRVIEIYPDCESAVQAFQ
ncbi:MAG: STAS domain-containing protein [Candidatus Sumerlaeia bacterium]